MGKKSTGWREITQQALRCLRMNWEDLSNTKPGMNVHSSSEQCWQSPGKDVCDETLAFSTQLTMSDF